MEKLINEAFLYYFCAVLFVFSVWACWIIWHDMKSLFSDLPTDPRPDTDKEPAKPGVMQEKDKSQ